MCLTIWIYVNVLLLWKHLHLRGILIKISVLFQALRQWSFQSFHRPETMTSYVSHKVQKKFSVWFVFEKTTYMIASPSLENPGCVPKGRQSWLSFPDSSSHVQWRSEGWRDSRHSGLPFTNQSIETQLYWQKFLRQSYHHSERNSQM